MNTFKGVKDIIFSTVAIFICFLIWLGIYVLSWLIPLSVIYFILHFVFNLF